MSREHGVARTPTDDKRSKDTDLLNVCGVLCRSFQEGNLERIGEFLVIKRHTQTVHVLNCDGGSGTLAVL
jgi:hypothetical protein